VRVCMVGGNKDKDKDVACTINITHTKHNNKRNAIHSKIITKGNIYEQSNGNKITVIK
jgi:hypothetical protein